MSSFLETLPRDNIRTLQAYQPGKPVEELERELGITGAIKLASNENPMGPSPRAIAAIESAASNVHRYPDGGVFTLRRALAQRLEVRPDELVFGAGSNELIYLAIQAFCQPGLDQVVTHDYAFISYRLAAMAFGVDFASAPVTGDLACDIDALIAAITPRTKLVFLANPNNPTGRHVEPAAFERLLEALPERALLVVDEAYHEYAVASGAAYPQSMTYRSEARPALLTLRTFSKIHGLAGLRIGYGVGDARVVEYLNRVRRPFNTSLVAQAAALAALDDDAHLQRSADAARTGIAALSGAVASLGLRAYPSLTNFVLIDVARDPEPLYEALLRRGVIVRPMRAWGLPQHIRISVGTPAESERAARTLAELLA